MCGRYALGIRAAAVRYQMQQSGMNVDDAPADEDTRETYNFAPGYHGLVYRADVPPTGAGPRPQQRAHQDNSAPASEVQGDPEHASLREQAKGSIEEDLARDKDPPELRYKLQAMQWGLIPSWTKRDPGYSGMLKTINCRDDSLAKDTGMWKSMKKGKRCIVVAQGFYEWLKKDGGKTKVPHFVKRKDGQLMCFAGLWDCVTNEDKHWTYTIVTTDSNKQLSFLHDRMPVILENGSEDIRTWLDPKRNEWTNELQSLLKPYGGELEIYRVSKEVGKVGNNSPDFIIPVDSSENKNNIANFFNTAKAKPGKGAQKDSKVESKTFKGRADTKPMKEEEEEEDEDRQTVDIPRSEDNAPMPAEKAAGTKHNRSSSEERSPARKHIKSEEVATLGKAAHKSPPTNPPVSGRKTRSATSNGSAVKEEKAKSAGGGSQKITDFLVR